MAHEAHPPLSSFSAKTALPRSLPRPSSSTCQLPAGRLVGDHERACSRDDHWRRSTADLSARSRTARQSAAEIPAATVPCRYADCVPVRRRNRPDRQAQPPLQRRPERDTSRFCAAPLQILRGEQPQSALLSGSFPTWDSAIQPSSAKHRSHDAAAIDETSNRSREEGVSADELGQAA